MNFQNVSERISNLLVKNRAPRNKPEKVYYRHGMNVYENGKGEAKEMRLEARLLVDDIWIFLVLFCAYPHLLECV